MRARLLARRARFSIDGEVLLEASALWLALPFDDDAVASDKTSAGMSTV
jgi:chorismate-pyruvate lyase